MDTRKTERPQAAYRLGSRYKEVDNLGNSTVFVNGQGMSSTNSGAITVSGPDPCLTPMGTALVPVPYTNTARSATLADGTKTVKIDGSMGTIDGCCYSTSTGDQPGSGKGVVSGTVGDRAEFINCSFDVKIEGKGACRNSDPMTHNSKNALGVNQDSAASPPASELATELPEKCIFRFRVVEHLSWDAYDEGSNCFKFGNKENKPIGGRKFKIRFPDGTVIERTTDDDGVIELTDQDPCSKYDVIFEPSHARLNNSYYLYYNGCRPLKKML